MEKASLDRRSFLRLCVVSAGGAVVAACEQKLQVVTPSPTSNASEPTVKMSFAGGSQDAWTWIKQVRVRVSKSACERVVIHTNGQESEARPEGDFFVAEVQLSEGENQVAATCMQPDGIEVQSESVVYTGRLRQVPTAVINISIEDGQIVFDGSQSLPPKGTQAAIVEYLWSVRDGNPTALQLTGEASGKSLTIPAPNIDGEYYLRLQVVDQERRADTSTTYFVVENGQPRIPDFDHEHPAWVENAIVYGIVPFLFGSPAFEAIGQRLDNLVDLGINTIWLGPINTHPVDDYGYAVEDYFGLDPAYGNTEDFRSLVQASHERGIRVLMDFVPSHTSNTHPYFMDAEQRGRDSNYWDFYARDEQGNYTYALNYVHLPKLNYENPEVRRMIIEAFAYWVREFDVDGFRVDGAWAVRDRRPDFWLEWRRELKRIKPDLMLLAEATAREPYYFDNGFDVAYDWIYRPGGWAWEIVWSGYKYRLLAYSLTEALTNRPEGFHPDAVIFRFLNHNDTGRRFITRHGEGVTRVATAMLLTLPGIPLLFTGDEYGLEFEPYQQLDPLTFKEKVPGLRDYHKHLIQLRKETPSLHSRQMSLLTPDAVPQTVFAYVRYGDPSEPPVPPVLVLLNFSEEPAELRFDVPEQFQLPADASTLSDLLTEESVPAFEGGRMQISVHAQTARVLIQKSVE